MKIYVCEAEPWEQNKFRALEQQHELIFCESPLRVENAERSADAEIISPFIYSELHADVLRRLPALKLIATRSTGVDHIDLEYCRSHGILVSNVPEYGETTVAEHVFGLILTISHNLYEAIDRTRRGNFSPQGLRGFDLRGKTLGVVGTGSIGRYVIEIAGGFGMKVLAYDLRPREELAARMGFRYAALDELLAAADIITLHVPATPQTQNLISTEQFARMKRGAVLINTARGSLVDIRALLQALIDGRVAAAGLDVLPEEPSIREEAELLRSMFRQEHNLETLLANHVLLRLRNVYVTPHSAFDTREAVERIVDTTIENILSFVQGAARNTVT